LAFKTYEIPMQRGIAARHSAAWRLKLVKNWWFFFAPGR
jgi:hypothetical protein